MILIVFLSVLLIGTTVGGVFFYRLYKQEKVKRLFETSRCNTRDKLIDQQDSFIWELIRKQEKMQDHLSSALCPMNNHIWIGGKCSKCGRAKDAPHE